MLIQYFVSTYTHCSLPRKSFQFCSARVGQITRNTAPIFIRVSYSSLFPRICPDPERWMPFEYLVALNTLQNAWLSKPPRISLNEGQTLKLCYDDNVKFKHRRERKLIRSRGGGDESFRAFDSFPLVHCVPPAANFIMPIRHGKSIISRTMVGDFLLFSTVHVSRSSFFSVPFWPMNAVWLVVNTFSIGSRHWHRSSRS